MAVTFSPGSTGSTLTILVPLAARACLRDLVALLPVDPAHVGEEEDEVMGGGGKGRIHTVLLFGGHGGDAPAAPLLRAVGGGGVRLMYPPEVR